MVVILYTQEGVRKMNSLKVGEFCFFSYMGRKRMVEVVKDNKTTFTGWDFTRKHWRTFKKSKIRRFTNQSLAKNLAENNKVG